jgi:predicted nucleic acid-binding protein
LSREKFEMLAPFEDRMKFCDNVSSFGQIMQPLYHFQVFDDPADDKFFSLAYSAAADCIVSGDEKHVRALKHLYGIQIWSPAQFLARETSAE